MQTMTISQVTKAYGVSTRTLRFYDQIGLLPSARRDDYAYRVYDAAAVQRLQQILLLRKLRIPLREIEEIFSQGTLQHALDVFCEQIRALDAQIDAMTALRDLLRSLTIRLNPRIGADGSLAWLADDALVRLIHTSAPAPSHPLKEELAMENLTHANQTLSRLHNVRILRLPPAHVATSHYFGPDPEENALKPLEAFARENALPMRKPDLRLFGFNDPSPTENETYGYTFWLTIPETLSVPAPLVKQSMAGGLYAVHCIKFGDFHEWRLLKQWVEDSEAYSYDAREPMGMHGCLEEQLNVYEQFSTAPADPTALQLDLMMPIRPKKA